LAIPPGQFRSILSNWASGVTIVTSRAGERVQGMTVSAFSSVSLTPPLVLVCADKQTITHGLIQQSKVFSVSVLAADQSELSNRFASKKDEDRRFEGLRCEDGSTGCPRIPGALAWLDCRVVESVDAGDHVIYVGEVVAADAGSAEPLLYFRARYAGLTRS
jgi:flavin reductase (DIM6/NTAB) family NADH-FMN oxidoreductase RutF